MRKFVYLWLTLTIIAGLFASWFVHVLGWDPRDICSFRAAEIIEIPIREFNCIVGLNALIETFVLATIYLAGPILIIQTIWTVLWRVTARPRTLAGRSKAS